MSRESRHRWARDAVLLVVPAAVALAYHDVSAFGYVWDDNELLRWLTADGVVRPWRDVGWAALPFSENYFRPLPVWSFQATFRAFGLGAAALHVGNLVVHALNATLVAALVRRMAPDRTSALLPAALAGLLYGLHPALVEPTAWISGRFDLLVTTGLLAMLLADHCGRGRPRRRALGVGAAFAAGLACKETAVVFPAVLALWHLATPAPSVAPSSWRRDERAVVWLSVACVAFAWFWGRWFALGAVVVPEATVGVGGGVERVLVAAHSLWSYATLSCWPFDGQRPLHHVALPLGSTGAWLALAASAAGISALGLRAIRGSAAAWLTLAAAVVLVPVLHVWPLSLSGGVLVAERYLAAPLALVALAIGVTLARAEGRLRVALGIVAIAFVVASAVAVRSTAPNWRDPVVFWEWAEEGAPESIVPPVNLAKTLYEAREYERSLVWAARALTIEHDHPFAGNNGCASLIALDRPHEAIAWCRIGIDGGRASPAQWVNLMRAQLAAGRPGDALETHRTAAERWGLRTERMETLRAEAMLRVDGAASP